MHLFSEDEGGRKGREGHTFASLIASKHNGIPSSGPGVVTYTYPVSYTLTRTHDEDRQTFFFSASTNSARIPFLRWVGRTPTVWRCHAASL